MDSQVRQVIDIARRILSGDLDPIEGCRQINEHRWDLDNDGLDPRFDAFVEFDRRTMSFPSRSARHLYNPEYLASLDAEAEAFLSAALPIFFQACRQLIHSFGEDAA